MNSILKVGDKASLSKKFTDDDVRQYAHLSLDTNPVHLDASYAAESVFGKKIVHGMLAAGLFSAVLGTILPGEGSIYLGQTLNFKLPIYIGEEITASVEVIKIRTDKPIVTLRTICLNSEGSVVIEVEAVVKAP